MYVCVIKQIPLLYIVGDVAVAVSNERREVGYTDIISDKYSFTRVMCNRGTAVVVFTLRNREG